MFYNVTAQLRTEMAGDLRRALLDDTIRNQKPDGPEIVDSLTRAVVTTDGAVEWSEVCYCEPPLATRPILRRDFDSASRRIPGASWASVCRVSRRARFRMTG